MNLLVLFGMMPYGDYDMLGIREKKKVSTRNKSGESRDIIEFWFLVVVV